MGHLADLMWRVEVVLIFEEFSALLLGRKKFFCRKCKNRLTRFGWLTKYALSWIVAETAGCGERHWSGDFGVIPLLAPIGIQPNVDGERLFSIVSIRQIMLMASQFDSLPNVIYDVKLKPKSGFSS